MTNGLPKHANATVHEPKINKRAPSFYPDLDPRLRRFESRGRGGAGEGRGGGEKWRACAHQWKMGRNENSGNGVTVMNL